MPDGKVIDVCGGSPATPPRSCPDADRYEDLCDVPIVPAAKGVTLTHSIFATKKGAKYFNPKSDLSSATIKAISPLKGGLTYKADDGTSSPNGSFGTLTGSIKATFDFVGTKTIKAATTSLSKF